VKEALRGPLAEIEKELLSLHIYRSLETRIESMTGFSLDLLPI
jgi:hypothetical protein